LTNDVLLRLRGKLPEQTSLDARVDEHYRSLGRHYVAIVEYVVAARTEPDPESEAHPTAALLLTKIELPADDADDERVRELMRELWAKRTAAGTIPGIDGDEDFVEPTGEVTREPTALSSVPSSGAGRSRTRGRGGRG
jgi:hypothetical protein